MTTTKPPTEIPSGQQWYDSYLERCPAENLPPDLAKKLFGLNAAGAELVLPIVLAILAGLLVESRTAQARGPVVRLAFNVIVTGTGAKEALVALLEPLKVCQNGAGHRPNIEPIWLDAPRPTQLKAALAASPDLLVTDLNNVVLSPLVTAKPGRTARHLASLLVAGTDGQQITRGKTTLRPRLSFILGTDPTTLTQALVSPRAEVQAIMARAVLAGAEPGTAPPNWTTTVAQVLDLRRTTGPGDGVLDPHPYFFIPLQAWPARLRRLKAATPPPLRTHFGPFPNLPTQLAYLFHELHFAPPFDQQYLSQAAVEISQWLLAQTLAMASDAYRGRVVAGEAAAKADMHAKIRASGPLHPWELFRHYNLQHKARHQPVLDALLAEGRVQIDGEGKLVTR